MTIIAAVDGERVPSRVVETADELARDLDEELVVMHVMPQRVYDDIKNSVDDDGGLILLAPGVSYTDESTTQSGGSARTGRSYSMEEGQKDAMDIARDVVEETLGDSSDVTLRGRVGEPVTEVLAEADSRDARYLAIGGRKRTPVGKAVFGSITQSLLLNAELPVLTVMHNS